MIDYTLFHFKMGSVLVVGHILFWIWRHGVGTGFKDEKSWETEMSGEKRWETGPLKENKCILFNPLNSRSSSFLASFASIRPDDIKGISKRERNFFIEKIDWVKHAILVKKKLGARAPLLGPGGDDQFQAVSVPYNFKTTWFTVNSMMYPYWMCLIRSF